jgi:Eukaryotic aspartyl protease
VRSHLSRSINLLLAALVSWEGNIKIIALARPPRANLLPSFSLHCPHDVPRGASKTAAANSTADTSNGVSSVDINAAEKATLTPANAPQAANSLGLAIEDNDVGYVAIVQMGTPPRDFNLLMDSGSADLWVGAEGCQTVTGGVAGGDCVSSISDLFSASFNCSSLLWYRATMCFSVHNHRLHLWIHKSPSM